MSTALEYTFAEQEKLNAVKDLEDRKARGKFVLDQDLAEARQVATWAHQNTEARQRHWQIAQDAQARKEAEYQAEREQRIAEEQAAYKRRALDAFPGTQAEFEREWPEILRRWQQGRTLAALEHDTQAEAATRALVRSGW